MDLIVTPNGQLRHIYDDNLDLTELGRATISRASFVEPDVFGHWLADLSPVHGPILGPFVKRAEALAAEVDWLEQHGVPTPIAESLTAI